MKETFERVKEELVEYLLTVDKAQLSMMDLSSYVAIVHSVNDMLKDKKPPYDIMGALSDCMKPTAVPTKGVQDNG